MSEELRREVRVDVFEGETRILWLLHGEQGTVQFVLRVTRKQPDPRWPSIAEYEMKPWDVGVHWRTPLSYMPDDPPIQRKCEILDGPCWYDGSGLAPSRLWEKVEASDQSKAEGLIWAELTDWYESTARDQKEAVSA